MGYLWVVEYFSCLSRPLSSCGESSSVSNLGTRPAVTFELTLSSGHFCPFFKIMDVVVSSRTGCGFRNVPSGPLILTRSPTFTVGTVVCRDPSCLCFLASIRLEIPSRFIVFPPNTPSGAKLVSLSLIFLPNKASNGVTRVVCAAYFCS